MGDLINLNRVRKRSLRDQSAKQAEVNRARFGRTKVQRALDEQSTDRVNNALDQHRIGGEDES